MPTLAATARTLYHVQCYDRDGRLCWEEHVPNLVTTVGLNKLLDATFKTGLAAPAWYVGLVNATGFTAFAVGDTMSSHTGWSETVPYSDATRPAFTPGTIASGSVNNSAAKATFTINATATLHGAFMADNSTKSGTTGVLYGEAAFSTPRGVVSTNTLTITVTLSIS